MLYCLEQKSWTTLAGFLTSSYPPTYHSKENAPWRMIDFSQLGFIGKMFQSDQLNLAKILSILLLACRFFQPWFFTQLFERTMVAGLEIMGIFFMCFFCVILSTSGFVNHQFRVLRCFEMEVLSWEFKDTPPMPYQGIVRHHDLLIIP